MENMKRIYYCPRAESGGILKRKGPWTPEEDAVLSAYIEANGVKERWRNLPEKAGLLRSGKSCRLRWINYLRPDIKRGGISPEEADLIIRLHKLIGNRWSIIAGRLPGRTDNEIKNYWKCHLRKRISNSNKDLTVFHRETHNAVLNPLHVANAKLNTTCSTSGKLENTAENDFAEEEEDMARFWQLLEQTPRTMMDLNSNINPVPLSFSCFAGDLKDSPWTKTAAAVTSFLMNESQDLLCSHDKENSLEKSVNSDFLRILVTD